MPDSDVIDTGAAISDAVREAAKRMCLQQPTPMASGESKVRVKRKASPARHGVLWQSVEIVKEHDTSPQLKCKNCAKTFCGGATRIELHICEQCDCDTTTFLEMKEKVLSEKAKKDEKKTSKRAAADVNMVADEETPVMVKS